MFGLPIFTVIAIFGVSAIWVVYTIVFFLNTRHWVKEDSAAASAVADHRQGTAPKEGGAA